MKKGVFRGRCLAGLSGGLGDDTLRVVDSEGESVSQELTLTATNPVLGASEVIAQGIVNELVRITDGDLGYRLVIDGIYPLFVGTSGWSAGRRHARRATTVCQPGMEVRSIGPSTRSTGGVSRRLQRFEVRFAVGSRYLPALAVEVRCKNQNSGRGGSS